GGRHRIGRRPDAARRTAVPFGDADPADPRLDQRRRRGQLTVRGLVSGWVAAALLLGSGAATAEPWLAVREGLACGSCHFNPSGGGLRSAFGIAYAQQQLPARALGAEEPAWTGTLTEPVRLGVDA